MAEHDAAPGRPQGMKRGWPHYWGAAGFADFPPAEHHSQQRLRLPGTGTGTHHLDRHIKWAVTGFTAVRPPFEPTQNKWNLTDPSGMPRGPGH